jgi:hypothetical protein
MGYAAGGELFERIFSAGTYQSEDDVHFTSYYHK